MKTWLMMVGLALVAFHSAAVADVAKSSKGSALCELNHQDREVAKKSATPVVPEKKSEAAR